MANTQQYTPAVRGDISNLVEIFLVMDANTQGFWRHYSVFLVSAKAGQQTYSQ